MRVRGYLVLRIIKDSSRMINNSKQIGISIRITGKEGDSMAYDTLIKEAGGLSEDKMLEVIDFILFLKAKSSNEGKTGKKRVLGVFKDESFFMADDFDETPSCFKEYV